ncbi:MAG: hypothetical protein RR313_11745 [Anaerovoracaceae bacterium]
MYIKYRKLTDKSIVIINADISSCLDIVTMESYLVISMKETQDDIKLKFANSDDARLAQEKLFITLGLKSPYNIVLDLTELSVLESTQTIGVTLQDIAEKFKLDVRELAIVATKSFEKSTDREISVNEETE